MYCSQRRHVTVGTSDRSKYFKMFELLSLPKDFEWFHRPLAGTSLSQSMILESLHTCTETVSVLLVYKVHEVLSKTRFTTPAATNRSEDKVQQSYLSSVLGREVHNQRVVDAITSWNCDFSSSSEAVCGFQISTSFVPFWLCRFVAGNALNGTIPSELGLLTHVEHHCFCWMNHVTQG